MRPVWRPDWHPRQCGGGGDTDGFNFTVLSDGQQLRARQVGGQGVAAEGMHVQHPLARQASQLLDGVGGGHCSGRPAKKIWAAWELSVDDWLKGPKIQAATASGRNAVRRSLHKLGWTMEASSGKSGIPTYLGNWVWANSSLCKRDAAKCEMRSAMAPSTVTSGGVPAKGALGWAHAVLTTCNVRERSAGTEVSNTSRSSFDGPSPYPACQPQPAPASQHLPDRKHFRAPARNALDWTDRHDDKRSASHDMITDSIYKCHHRINLF